MADKKITDLTSYTNPDRVNDVLPIVNISGNQTEKITINNALGITGAPVGTSDTQTISNKSLGNTNTLIILDSTFTLQDNVDITKQAAFQLSGITTGNTRTYTLPDVTDTLVSLTATQTLTNKTLTSPTITNPSITNATITADTVAGFTTTNSGSIYGIPVAAAKIGIANITTTASSALVDTSETTTSTSFSDLATTTDTVTATVGADGLLQISISAFISNSGSNSSSVGFALSGANTMAAADNLSLFWIGTNPLGIGASFLLNGLTAGSTTVKMKYKVSAGTGTFSHRRVAAIPV